MVFGGVDEFLRRRNIHGEDIPKILGTFVVAKYTTTLGFLFIGIRYRPMHRALAPYWKSSAVERAALARRARGEAVRRWTQMQTKVEQFRRTQSGSKMGEAQWLKARARWDYEKTRRNITGPVPQWIRKESASHFKEYARKVRKSSRMRWIAEKYKYYEDLFAQKAEQSRWFSLMSSWLRKDPRNLALGIAEGLIITKFMFPITGPLELYLLTKFFQWRRSRMEEIA